MFAVRLSIAVLAGATLALAQPARAQTARPATAAAPALPRMFLEGLGGAWEATAAGFLRMTRALARSATR